MTAITTVTLTFILTGLIGNWLVSSWQHRNWLNQQQFLGEEKEYLALTSLSDEIISLAARRLSRMRRLLVILSRPEDDIVRRRLTEYDESLATWDERLNSFFVRLTLYASHVLQQQLEHEVQKEFVSVGGRLEQLTKERLNKGHTDLKAIANLRADMSSLSHLLFTFNREILRVVRSQKIKTYYGTSIDLTAENLHRFTTWELFKALFKPGIKPLRIVRTPAELS